jgi:hypothetical protein
MNLFMSASLNQQAGNSRKAIHDPRFYEIAAPASLRD